MSANLDNDLLTIWLDAHNVAPQGVRQLVEELQSYRNGIRQMGRMNWIKQTFDLNRAVERRSIPGGDLPNG